VREMGGCRGPERENGEEEWVHNEEAEEVGPFARNLSWHDRIMRHRGTVPNHCHYASML